MAKVNGTFYTAEKLRSGATPVSPEYDGSEGQQPPVNPSVRVTPPVAIRYDSETAMKADQINQRSGYLYFDGTNTWWYKGNGTGVIGDYEEFGSSGAGTDPNAVHYNVADGKNAAERLQARNNIGSTSATPQVIATAGAINDLAATSNHLVFTGANVVISGIVAGLNGEEITLLNASGTDLSVLSQSALSATSNRFNASVIIPNLSILRIKYRTTTNRWFLENVGINDGRYLRKDIDDNSIRKYVFSPTLLLNEKAIVINKQSDKLTGAMLELQYLGNRSATFASDVITFENLNTFRCNQDIPSGSRFFIINKKDATAGGSFAEFRVQESMVIRFDHNGRIVHNRSGASNESVIRDELYLNYSQIVATAGTINNLDINADCKLLVLSGATDLTGVVPVDNGRLLRIEARGANRIIRNESASSTADNRFSIGSDLTINSGEVFEFIYTNGKWRVLNNNGLKVTALSGTASYAPETGDFGSISTTGTYSLKKLPGDLIALKVDIFTIGVIDLGTASGGLRIDLDGELFLSIPNSNCDIHCDSVDPFNTYPQSAFFYSQLPYIHLYTTSESNPSLRTRLDVSGLKINDAGVANKVTINAIFLSS